MGEHLAGSYSENMRTRRSQLEQTYATDVITPTQLQPPWLQGQAVYPSGEREEDDDLDAEDDQEDQESPSKFVYPEPPSPPQTYESPNYGSAVEVMPADPALNNESSIGDGDEEEHFFNALLAEPDDRSDPDYSFMNEHDGSSDEIMSDEYRDEPEGRREPKRGRGGKRGSRGRGGRGRGNRITTPKRSEAARGRDDVLTSSPPPTTDWQVEPQGSNRRKRRKVTIEPSKEFRELQGKAHEAFVNMDFEEANRLAAEAQQENPEIFTNYVLRSEIYSAWGHPKKAVDILKHGSAFTRDPETLFRIAVRLGDFYTEPGTREWTLLRSIYTRILTEYYDPDHVGARTKRLEMWEKQDSPSMVVRDCLALLKQTPWDTYTLQKLSRWASKAGKLTAVPEAFEASIRYFKAVEKKGGQNFFDFSTVNIYMDVLYELEDFEKGVHGLRQLARWLVGRQDDTFWDPQPDDREWDIDDEPRRIQVPSFTAGKFEKSAYGEGLPLDLRILLGLFRLRLGPGHLAEAKVCLLTLRIFY